MRTLVELAIAAILLTAASALAFKQIRDGSGNLVGTETRVGNRTEFRDRDNNISRHLNREGSRWIIGNGSGNKIGEIDSDRGDSD